MDPQMTSRIYYRYNQHGAPSNRKQTGRPRYLTMKRKRIVIFITRDSHPRHLNWETICLEMDDACDLKTMRNVMVSLGYHKHVHTKDGVQCKTGQQSELGYLVSSQTARDEGVEESHMDGGVLLLGFFSRPWVIRKPDEEYHPDCVDLNFHSGRKSKMVWGVFCSTTNLIFPAARTSTPQPM